MERCVKYALSREEIPQALLNARLSEKDVTALLADNFHEVWGGLPAEYEFKPAETRGGLRALKAESRGVYIWILPEACDELAQNPQAVLTAVVRRSGNSLYASTVGLSIPGHGLPETAEHARRLNRDKLREAPIGIREMDRAIGAVYVFSADVVARELNIPLKEAEKALKRLRRKRTPRAS